MLLSFDRSGWVRVNPMITPTHNQATGPMNQILDSAREILREATVISLKLFKIMVPVIIAVKALQEIGMIDVLGRILSPFMGMVGLPGSMGLVLATSIMSSVYGGMAAFVSLSGITPLTVAQATVITSMVLIAHALPIELRIAQKAGVRMPVMAGIRILGAFVYGFLFHTVTTWGGWLQEPNTIAWIPPVEDTSLAGWGLGQLRGLAVITMAILGLLVVLKIFDRIGVTNLMVRCLEPVLRLLGIGKSAATLTIVGMTLGVAYGGALIIQQAQSGTIGKRDIFFSLSLMGLCHSILEDTFLMTLLGGHLSGILWGRVLFSLASTFVLVKWVSRLSEAAFTRFFILENNSSENSYSMLRLQRFFQGRQ